jgi:hypothetical protein
MEEQQDGTGIGPSWNHWDLPIIPSLTPGHPEPSSGVMETFAAAPLTCAIEENDWLDIGQNWGGWDLPIQSSATPVHSEPSVQVTQPVTLSLTRPPTEDPRGLREILEGVMQETLNSKRRLDMASQMPLDSVSASRIQCAIANLREAVRWLAPDGATKCERCRTRNLTCVVPIWSKEVNTVSRPHFRMGLLQI